MPNKLGDVNGGFDFSILNNNIFSVDFSETPNIPPVSGNFELLNNTHFLLLNGSDFLLL